ncbi:hypothetical protein Hanom_Chr00s145126g01820131 [Helianthus anomalus]
MDDCSKADDFDKGDRGKSTNSSETIETTPGTAPIKGISLRVTSIEGNAFSPKRGMFRSNNESVIDGLLNISKPVNLEYKGGYGGNGATAVNQPHANPNIFDGHANPNLVQVEPIRADGSNHGDDSRGKPLSYAESLKS